MSDILKKLGGLSADVTKTFRMTLLHPDTSLPIKAKDGRVAFIDLQSGDSEAGRSFDKEQRAAVTQKAAQGIAEQPDAFEQNIEKTARLTVAWLLVDPSNGEVIDIACNMENAKAIYANPGTAFIYRQAFMGANRFGNFMNGSSKGSAPSPSGSSEAAKN